LSEFLGSPVDPLDGPAFALGGRIVTMDAHDSVVEDGVVYVREGAIAAVHKANVDPPPDFEGVKVLETKGTIYPGLIDLHDHLSYNALQLWDVPKLYTNRDQWAKGDTYRKLVTGPMKVLAHTPEYVPAIVRYVEAKCLVAGTTTSQGIALSSYSGIQRFYKGIVRNVEQTDEDELPEAGTHIADVEAKDRTKFLKRLESFDCLLLHLSEGTDEKAREHFLALQEPNGDWAIASSLAGIHCVALEKKDFDVLAKAGASMVWSPLSNLLLYGKTADVSEAEDAGVLTALGPDWSPSGSKNLLGELKLARLVDSLNGGGLSDVDVIALATRNPAKILRWDEHLGSIEAGKRADLLVVSRATGDAHAHLFTRSEHDVELVVVNGVPRYGASTTMRKLLGESAPPLPDPGDRRPGHREGEPERSDRPAHGRTAPTSRARQRRGQAEGEPGGHVPGARPRGGRRRRSEASSPRSGRRPDGDDGRLRGGHAAVRPARAADARPADRVRRRPLRGNARCREEPSEGGS